jgi:hypothetical protein
VIHYNVRADKDSVLTIIVNNAFTIIVNNVITEFNTCAKKPERTILYHTSVTK